MKKIYRLEKHLCEDTEYYDKDPIEKYIDYLEEMGRLVRVNNLLLDAEAMWRPFICDTRLCITSKGGRKGKMKSCCVAYTPRLSTHERERVEELLPALQERFPGLEETIEKAEGFYYWDDECYDRLMTKNHKGLCLLQTPDTSDLGFYGCMIHAYCLEQGLSPHYYKPAACVMFPLFLLDVDNEEETVLVTGHSEEVMTLGESEENFEDAACCHPNKLAKNPLYVEMKETFVYMFGEEAWNEADKALRKWKKEQAE